MEVEWLNEAHYLNSCLS